GDLKLIENHEGGSTEVLMYDLAADPGEANNLASHRTAEAKRLQARIAAWEAEVQPPPHRRVPDNRGDSRLQLARRAPRVRRPAMCKFIRHIQPALDRHGRCSPPTGSNSRFPMMKITLARSLGLFLLAPALLMGAPASSLNLSRADYQDRVAAIWNGQIIATLLGFPFEHRASAVRSIVGEPIMYRGERLTVAPVDDDWYYEMDATPAFVKAGSGLTADQLVVLWGGYIGSR